MMKLSYLSTGVLLALAFTGCGPKAAPPAGRAAVPVTIATVVRKDVPVEVRVIGTVEPYATVAVRSLVSGELRSIHFAEGQDVRKDELLFNIDSRPFESDL